MNLPAAAPAPPPAVSVTPADTPPRKEGKANGEKESISMLSGKLDWKRKDSASSKASSTAAALPKPASNPFPNGAVPAILEGMQTTEQDRDNLLAALQSLFVRIAGQKKKTGVIGPQQFVLILKRENELFRSTMHQDAHEMLNYLLNAIAEILLRHKEEMLQKLKALPSFATSAAVPDHPRNSAAVDQDKTAKPIPPPSSWVHALFEGVLTNETKCLTCEMVTSRDETFLDLSVDVEPNCSLSYCLRNFSNSETLCKQNKFFCDTCNSLQEAEKRMIVRKTPNILAVHLKRFKYQEQLQRYIKLSYRVPFPFELRLSNFTDDAENPERLYKLFAVIVHIGNGPHHGHYVTLVKSQEQWLLFDDDEVSPVDESELHKYYGDNHQAGCGYIFFYITEDFDANELLQSMQYVDEQDVSTSAPSPSPLHATAASSEETQPHSAPDLTFLTPEHATTSVSNLPGRPHTPSDPPPPLASQHTPPPSTTPTPAPAPPTPIPSKMRLGKRPSVANVLQTTLAAVTGATTSASSSTALSGMQPSASDSSTALPLPGVVLEEQEGTDGKSSHKEGWGWFSMGKKDKDKHDRDKK
ncbi:hypothetical protein HKX48_004151 [Thoreauomyces humboldtii]|nr:hypothetical protein HKX48_004151 [Thoreauomyces humboldtii]